ncbi:hypothetical protein BDV93DRAFT_560523 [Ceratobasidium sp. AG-I]|nr:hypothetical protein BDV93DRAFT_560523 [Ceratobasidium sp. AG-I]
MSTTLDHNIQLKRTFTRVGNSEVYVSHPPKDLVEVRIAGRPPSVILILGWMGAPLSHLHKHTETYHRLYPSATQILVRINYTYFRKSEAAVSLDVAPVVKLLQDAGIHAYDAPETSGLLIHTFSSGPRCTIPNNALSQTTLMHILSSHSNTPTPGRASLPAQALIYDSLPGTLAPRMTIRAFTTNLPYPPLRYLLAPFLFLFWAAVATRFWALSLVKAEWGEKEMFRRLHSELNDPRLVPQRAPRTYMYSDIDEISAPASVERHAKVARERLNAEGADGDGLVKLEMFKGSSHILHARKEPERYWGIVVRTWEASFRGGERPVQGMLKSKL